MFGIEQGQELLPRLPLVKSTREGDGDGPAIL